MESRTLGREVQLDPAGRRLYQSVSQAAEEIRGLVQSLVEGGSETTSDDVMGRLSLALLEAQEQERSRLAEELHDGPAQALANAIFQTEILERAIREDPVLADAELASLRQILERELDTLRGYINQLRPSLREAEGLDDALRDSAAAVSQRTGMPVEVTLGAPAAELHDAARTVVLRVAQEALRNIAKHSGASRAWLVTRSIEEPDGGRKWQLEVGDDGQGFDIDEVTAHPNRRHFGLRFMHERADLLGSELTIKTSPAAGTVVRLTTDIGG
ncbi:MAG: sensor histidine kinase [Chloroflexota bacterium]